MREGREVKANWRRYTKDPWNVFDLCGLLFLFIGLVFRWIDSANELGPEFYALSVPMLFCRILFFAQILPFQGPMIQVKEGRSR